MIAIDPGNEQSAWVAYRDGVVIDAGIYENGRLHEALPALLIRHGVHLVIEMIASYGMPVGREVFETCVWIGRFLEVAGGADLVYRKDVKLHLCGQTRAKDANIRQALIDRFGPSKEKAIGTKKAPGPLYGFKADMWAALAVAVTYDDTRAQAAA